MKVRNLFLLLFIGAMIGVSSCKKEDQPESSSVLNQQAFFNNLGINHNKVLTFVGENADVSKMKAEDRFNLACKFIGSNSLTWEDMQESFKTTNQILANPENASIYLLKKRYDSELTIYYDSLALIMAHCLNNATDSNSIVTPEVYNQMIAGLENQIYANFDVEINTETSEGNEAALFLGACAISRYSYQFWYNAATDPNNPWYDYINNGNSRFLSGVWHAIKVAAADTWGFLTTGWDVDLGAGTVTWNLHDAWNGGSRASSSVD